MAGPAKVLSTVQGLQQETLLLTGRSRKGPWDSQTQTMQHLPRFQAF